MENKLLDKITSTTSLGYKVSFEDFFNMTDIICSKDYKIYRTSLPHDHLNESTVIEVIDFNINELIKNGK